MVTRTPEWLEERRLALHELVAAEIRRAPWLFDRVKGNLDRWRSQRNAPGASYLAWYELVADGIETTLAAATERSERGNALRGASPFAGVLDEETRLAFLDAWSRRCDR